MPKLRFTPQLVKSAVCEQGKRKTLFFDSDCKWLVLEVRSTHTATYYLRYPSARGGTRLLKLGDVLDLTLAQARQKADKYRSMIAMGQDPAADKAVHRQVPTVNTFIHDSYPSFRATSGHGSATKACSESTLNPSGASATLTRSPRQTSSASWPSTAPRTRRGHATACSFCCATCFLVPSSGKRRASPRTPPLASP